MTPTLGCDTVRRRTGGLVVALTVALAPGLLIAGCSVAPVASPSWAPSATEAAPEPDPPAPAARSTAPASIAYDRVDADTPMVDVISHPALEGFGRFLFPIGRGVPDGPLRDAGALLPYHRNVDADTSVDVVNSLVASVEDGRTVFYDIYPAEAMAADPGKEDTGLFFFEGEPGAPFAIVSAGGGFSYVGSIHESLPHALELSRRGYNAFALQYRTGGLEVASEDLAAALSFVFAHADDLAVGTYGYSLWGGSAGARMAANLGSYGAGAFGGDPVPRPATVVMQYTGYTDYTGQDPPTFACVGEDDAIADWRVMEHRIEQLEAAGVESEFHVFPDVGHGFGLGLGTPAEGWIDSAVAFWERHL